MKKGTNNKIKCKMCNEIKCAIQYTVDNKYNKNKNEYTVLAHVH